MRTDRRLLSALGFMLAAFSFVGGPLVSVAGASAVCAPAPSGLTSWYPADGNANDTASSTAATLTGQTLDGRCVSGTDSVTIVP